MPAGAADPSSNGRAPYEGERSVGQLFAAATADLSALVHDEIALAKAEIRADVKRGVSGGVSLAVAGVVALAAVPMLSAAAAFGIHALGLSLGWSFLVVVEARTCCWPCCWACWRCVRSRRSRSRSAPSRARRRPPTS